MIFDRLCVKIAALTMFLFVSFLTEPAIAADDVKDHERVQRFFARYIHLNETFDASVADLYADSAVISSFRRHPDGRTRNMAMPGAQWKALVRQVMPIAKMRGDRSIYREIRITIKGDHAKIKASRYSVIKCYLDQGYYMIVSKQADGSYQIIEEYSETQPQSDCKLAPQ